MDEMNDVVDESDNVVGVATRSEIRAKNLLHRGVIVLVFNSAGEIFVHKRTSTKDIHPSLYDMTCGGGVVSGEDYDYSALRETEEELGVKGVDLKFLFKFRYKSDIDNYIANVYYCVYDGEIVLQKEEVEHGRFMPIDELKKLIGEVEFCPDSIEIFKKYEQSSA